MHSYAMSLSLSATLHPSIVTLSSSPSEHGVLGCCFSLLPIVWDSGGGMCACLKLSSSRPSLSTLVYTRWYIYDPPPLPSQSSRPAFTINHYHYYLHQKILLESLYHRLRYLLLPPPPPPPLRWTNYTSSRPTTTTNDHPKSPKPKGTTKKKMPFSFPTRRTSTQSNSSSSSNSNSNSSSRCSSIDETLLATTLPIAPREDNYAISEQIRQKRLLVKCKRLETDGVYWNKSVKQQEEEQGSTARR